MQNLPLFVFFILFLFILSYFYFIVRLSKDIGLIKDIGGFFTHNIEITNLAWDIFIGKVKSENIKKSKYFKIVQFHLRFYPVVFIIWIYTDAVFSS